MTTSFSEFMILLSQALTSQEGPQLAYLLRPTSPHGKDIMKELRNPSRESLRRYSGSMESPWDEIAIHYALVVYAIAKKRHADAFAEQTQLVSLFYRYFGNNTGWTLPALFAILRDLRDIAHDADIASQKTDSTEQAASMISKALTFCLQDRTSSPAESRKWGTYYVVGLLMKGYFRLKRIALCRNVLRALQNHDIPPLSSYPRAHQVTYQYYLGCYHFLNEDYEKAEKGLAQAFYNCHVDATNNQRRILLLLIPLRLLLGQLPTQTLLDRFPELREVYWPFVHAIRKADIKAYDDALYQWERRLLESNVWLVFEKAREIAMRGLFRRVWVASNRSTRIPIHMFHCAIRVTGMRVDVEEVECYVANMIHKGFIKGYISHERQMVVLAASDAFPPVADRKNPYSVYL